MNVRLRTVTGFTLIELVVVIIILSVLAAVAVPKFIDMSSKARVAAVKSLAGAVRTASTQWQMMCRMDPVCSSEINLQSHEYVAGGRYVNFNYEFVSAGGNLNADQIDTLVNFSGFTASIPSYVTLFSLDGAPDPANCAVQYVQAYATSVPHYITVTELTSGC